MRKIKYRAWHIVAKRMCPVTRMTFGRLGIVYSEELINTINDVELMQYTGLKDKNGVEIYDGDILAYKTSSSCYSKYGEKHVVVYEGSSFQCEYQYGDLESFLSDMTIEVIGNIHENPELLTLAK